ncbi:MAG: ribosome recycling factor [Clostridia bacterium]|nr:ribosome recycling factor [Clostridia bacterium]MBR6783160.1 ribosome recycling factor [Clostridia bacterium]
MFNVKPFEERMKKSISVLEEDFATIRVGRASAKVLDKITVPYYGTPTGLDGVATIKASDARTLVITPWEANMVKEIEKAILASDVGITPTNDGKCVRLVFPALTEERRKELTKKTAKMGEECKVAIRNIRRDANDAAKAMKKNSEITEDDLKAAEKSIQDVTDKYIKEVDSVVARKDKEIMEI